MPLNILYEYEGDPYAVVVDKLDGHGWVVDNLYPTEEKARIAAESLIQSFGWPLKIVTYEREGEEDNE